MRDSLTLQPAAMTFSNIEIKIEKSVKFLGVVIDKKLNMKKPY